MNAVEEVRHPHTVRARAGRGLGADRAAGRGGTYTGANFTFRTDPALDGHTVRIRGTAERDGVAYPFTAAVDVAEDTPLVGAPFEAEIRADSTGTLVLEALTTDPFEPDSLFDDVDFAAEPAPIAIAPGQAAHNRLARNLQLHDFYVVTRIDP